MCMSCWKHDSPSLTRTNRHVQQQQQSHDSHKSPRRGQRRRKGVWECFSRTGVSRFAPRNDFKVESLLCYEIIVFLMDALTCYFTTVICNADSGLYGVQIMND